MKEKGRLMDCYNLKQNCLLHSIEKIMELGLRL